MVLADVTVPPCGSFTSSPGTVQRNSFGGAAPELQQKLARRLERMSLNEGDGLDEQGGLRRLAPEVNLDGNCSASSDSEGGSGSDAEPLEYLMLGLTSHLPSQEAAEVLEKVQRCERRHSQVEQELRRRRLADVNPQDGSTPDASVSRGAARVRHRKADCGARADCFKEAVALAPPPPRSLARAHISTRRERPFYAAADLGAECGEPLVRSEREVPERVLVTSPDFQLRSNLFRLAELACVLAAVVVIAIAALVIVFHAGDRARLAAHAGIRPTPAFDVTSMGEERHHVQHSSDIADFVEARARGIAFNLAMEEGVQREMRRAVEIAAERLLAEQVQTNRMFAATLPQNTLVAKDPRARREALRDRVRDLEQHGYQVLIRPPDEVSPASAELADAAQDVAVGVAENSGRSALAAEAGPEPLLGQEFAVAVAAAGLEAVLACCLSAPRAASVASVLASQGVAETTLFEASRDELVTALSAPELGLTAAELLQLLARLQRQIDER